MKEKDFIVRVDTEKTLNKQDLLKRYQAYATGITKIRDSKEK